MKKITITTLTIALVLAATQQASAGAKNSKEAKNEIIVPKTSFTNEIVKTSFNENEVTTVDVDYMIDENGKANITWINSANAEAKFEVVKFIEGSSYNFNMVPGRIYSMKLTLAK